MICLNHQEHPDKMRTGSGKRLVILTCFHLFTASGGSGKGNHHPKGSDTGIHPSGIPGIYS